MSNSSDVENTLLATLAGAMGVENYAIGQVVTTSGGHKVRFLRGWPVDNELATDRLDQVTPVTIFPVPGMNQERGHYLDVQMETEKTPITIHCEVDGNRITFSGEATPGQVVGVAMNKTGWSIRLSNQTAQDIAAQFAQEIPEATADGATLTLPSSDVWADVVSDSITTTYLAEDNQHYRISIWSWSPFVRDELGGVVRSCMTGIRSLTLPDGENTGKPQFMNSWVSDKTTKADTYTRDYQYSLSYPITLTEVSHGVLFVGVEVNETHKVGIWAPES